jgi:hypothetical protein
MLTFYYPVCDVTGIVDLRTQDRESGADRSRRLQS